MHILSWVPPLDLLRSVARVDTHLSSIIQLDAFWESLAAHLLLRKTKLSESESEPEGTSKTENQEQKEGPSSSSLLSLNKHQLQRVCLYRAATSVIKEQPPPACLRFGSLLISQQQALALRNNYSSRRRACIASSSHHTFEMLENALAPGRNRWWCSRPSPSQEDTNDTLLLTTKCPLAMMSKIYIRPMAYPHGEDRIFTWRETQIKAYRLPLSKLSLHNNNNNPPQQQQRAGFPCTVQAPSLPGADMTRNFPINVFFQTPVVVDSNQERNSLASLLQGETPVYESGTVPSRHRSYSVGEGPVSALPEIFDLPNNVIANVVTLTLIGKDMQEPGTNDYYVGVEHLDVVGIPLISRPEEKELLGHQYTERSRWNILNMDMEEHDDDDDSDEQGDNNGWMGIPFPAMRFT